MRDFVLPEMWDKLSVVVRTGRKLETRSPKFETNSNFEIEKGRVLQPYAALLLFRGRM